MRRDGVQLAVGDSATVRRVPVPVVDRPADAYDLVIVFVRTHQVGEVLPTLADVGGDVLFVLNWAAGPAPLAAALGADRVLLGTASNGGVMDGDVLRYRPPSRLTRLVPMSIGDVPGPRADRILQVLTDAGIRAKLEPQIDAWLKTHAAFEVPLGQAVDAAGGREALASDSAALRDMIRQMRERLAALRTPVVPRGLRALQVVPEGLLVPVFRRFLRSRTVAYSGLDSTSPASVGEYAMLAEQLDAA
ncbi:ketopantoate reductase family protein [Dactylosporangium matsuzakiense]|uniref:ketopantoate reductase family protein n=1 Tax=Dactylosporangium matsuzakiense TaxID=53360 RepID=UPI0031EC7446